MTWLDMVALVAIGYVVVGWAIWMDVAVLDTHFMRRFIRTLSLTWVGSVLSLLPAYVISRFILGTVEISFPFATILYDAAPSDYELGVTCLQSQRTEDRLYLPNLEEHWQYLRWRSAVVAEERKILRREMEVGKKRKEIEYTIKVATVEWEQAVACIESALDILRG